MEHEFYQHPASGEFLYRSVLAPDKTTWEDCFSDWLPYQTRDLLQKPFTSLNVSTPDVYCGVGPYCTISGEDGNRGSAFVQTQAWMADALAKRLVVSDPHMFFEVIVHPTGWALVTACYNRIIGDAWLAYIRADTIPDNLLWEHKNTIVESNKTLRTHANQKA